MPELVEIPGIEGTPITEQSFFIMQDRFCLTMTHCFMINEHIKKARDGWNSSYYCRPFLQNMVKDCIREFDLSIEVVTT